MDRNCGSAATADSRLSASCRRRNRILILLQTATSNNSNKDRRQAKTTFCFPPTVAVFSLQPKTNLAKTSEPHRRAHKHVCALCASYSFALARVLHTCAGTMLYACSDRARTKASRCNRACVPCMHLETRTNTHTENGLSGPRRVASG